jgi:myo-inositol-1(or 4)-monophosphatase
MSPYLKVCEQAARRGGAVLLDWVDRFAVREKGPADLVTEADLASQQAVKKILLETYPEHGFLGEEGGEATAEAPFRWIVDPLDGTTNYVHQVPQYAVSVALEHEGRLIAGTVFDPVSGECFTAEAGLGAFLNGKRLKVSPIERLDRALVAASFPAKVRRGAAEIAQFVEVLLEAQAVRRTGSAALNLSYVAAGRFDAYWATETKTWDVAAGFLLIQEAGGLVTDLTGGPYVLDRPRFLAASTAPLHAHLVEMLDRARRNCANA